ncbi:ribonuclease H-like domain-containing protein [Crepidotus variabilis]|uniref:Ribonuclease H-like domain-containing protein n=1 Tax=Crepidotus variabilis TaxID=179855 RepID=A0A9P6ERK1_9AGAR|nr:ribonuclease H-like domain-containing protein [Crepidotus variabilis]
MRYQNRSRRPRPKKQLPISAVNGVSPSQVLPLRSKQYYDAFLVVDVEGTCKLGTDFNYPNEIIEFPVCIVEWRDRSEDGLGSVLEVVDEFRSFVKPTWRPTLSNFCTQLTGITQEQVDSSPHFPEVLEHLEAFLVKNGLIEQGTRQRLKKFCWCSDGPFDIRDFVVKQCYISQVQMPPWLQSDVLDVRSTVLQYLSVLPPASIPQLTTTQGGITRRSLNIATQLKVLELPEFQGRQHSGIDDTRNVAKVLIELARRGMCLLPNTTIHPGKRWAWMGRDGEVLEAGLTCA